MMFPDTSNDQQLAALRRSAERYRAAGNSPVEREHDSLKPLPQIWEGFNSGSAYSPESYASAPDLRSLSSR